jgi:hypothetical protein
MNIKKPVGAEAEMLKAIRTEAKQLLADGCKDEADGLMAWAFGEGEVTANIITFADQVKKAGGRIVKI